MLITILPDNIQVEARVGDRILDVISRAGIKINASCGGQGTCGRCAIEVIKGNLKKDSSFGNNKKILACKSYVNDEAELVINIPSRERLSSHQILFHSENRDNIFTLNPIIKKIPLKLDHPTITNNTDDYTRLVNELKKAGYKNTYLNLEKLRELPTILREGEWEVTAVISELGDRDEVLSLEPRHPNNPIFGLAIDIGTTTIKVNLIDLTSGLILDSQGDYNGQQIYGDDVISRIIYSTEKNGLKNLRNAVLETINEQISILIRRQGIKIKDIYAAAVAGNTTMIHLFLGIPAKHIRLEPYIPAVKIFPHTISGKEAGLMINNEAAVCLLPAVGSYVGGDITSGVLATQISLRDKLTLFIDIGTNGEIVLGNSDFQISCACSAGPCFEGGSIKDGMRAMDGAIEKFDIDENYKITFEVIGNKKPVGICGSGLIDAVSSLLKRGFIDRTGQFNLNLNDSRLRKGEDGYEFVLVWGKDTAHGQDILILETDIKNIVRAKAAIFAGIRVLIKHMGIELDMIDEILIAGGFGNFLRFESAVAIGMLPPFPIEKFHFVGNTSLQGAQTVLTSLDAWKEVLNFAKGMTYLELSEGNEFMDEFISACFLPHTDLGLFNIV